MSDDPFDSLFSLEETFYQSGYDAGVTDGSRAGRIEGRIFGLEKGFEKFVELGKLAGRAEVWKQRIQLPSELGASKNAAPVRDQPLSTGKRGGTGLQFDVNPRLAKHILNLCDLIEPATYDTRNTEDAVADFDDRYKRGKAKAKVVERLIGEEDEFVSKDHDNTAETTRRSELRISREQAQERNMEDFGKTRAASNS